MDEFEKIKKNLRDREERKNKMIDLDDFDEEIGGEVFVFNEEKNEKVEKIKEKKRKEETSVKKEEIEKIIKKEETILDALSKKEEEKIEEELGKIERKKEAEEEMKRTYLFEDELEKKKKAEKELAEKLLKEEKRKEQIEKIKSKVTPRNITIIAIPIVIISGAYITGKILKKEAEPVEEKNANLVVQDVNEKNYKGEKKDLREAFKKIQDEDQYRYTYSMNIRYNGARVVMDSVVSGKYSKKENIMKEYSVNNLTGLTANIFYDGNKKEYYYNKNDMVGRIEEKVMNSIKENYQWVAFNPEDVTDINVLKTNMNFKEKEIFADELENRDFQDVELTEEEINEGIKKGVQLNFDYENFGAYLNAMMFVNQDQQYISIMDMSTIEVKFYYDEKGRIAKEVYNMKAEKATGNYYFEIVQKYYGFDEKVEFEEILNEENTIDGKMMETIKKQLD